METKTEFIAGPGTQDVVMSRDFDAPRDIVFKAFLDSNLVPRWWGPRGMKTIVETMDVRPGGTWRIVQSDAEGGKYAFHGVYHTVESPRLIIQTFEFEGMPGHVSLETATLEEHAGGTRLTTRSIYQSVEDRDGALRSGMEKGARETLDRFAELLVEIVAHAV